MAPEMKHVGKHQQEIESLFSGKVRFAETAPIIPLPLVLMAFTNRCGSNLLGEHLRLTGNFAGFHEHLNGFAVKGMMEKTKATSFPEHISAIVPQQKQSISAFGVKASWDQILMLLRWRIDKMFTSLHVIHVERMDVLAQAVSFSIADQTKQWMSTQPANGKEVNYNFSDIRNRMEGIGTGNKNIRQICSVYDLSTHVSKYEYFTLNPISELDLIHKWLGITLSRIDLGKSRLKKQSGKLNEQLIKKFKYDEFNLLDEFAISKQN